MERYCVPSYPQIHTDITYTQNSSRDTHLKILLHILPEFLFIDFIQVNCLNVNWHNISGGQQFKKQKQHTKNQGYMDTRKNFKQYHV